MMPFCTLCAAPALIAIPEGDNRPRQVCSSCGHIHYDNPRLVVGCIATWENKILLCRRAIEPRLGFWTLPAGFMENGETTSQAAVRETLEEAGATVQIDAAFMMVSIAHIHQVHLFYRAHMISGEYSAGEESLEVRLFDSDSIPWEDLSFRSVGLCLKRFLSDRKRREYGFHDIELAPAESA